MMSILSPARIALAAMLLASMPILLRAAPPEPPEPASPSATILAEGRALTRQFLHGDSDAIWARMSPAMRDALKSAEALAQFRAKIAHDLGEEQSVIEESAQQHDGMRVYLRSARWSKAPMPIRMQWVLDDDDHIAGFVVQPTPQAAPSSHLDYQTRANLRLPFDGTWHVVWGGHTIEQNYHAASPGQRFAYDLLRMLDGKTHRGQGTALDDYYCWNQAILAPAEATVIEAIDGLPDQAIGTTNAQAPAGNHVMLDLGQGEYALLAHLRQGSVAVKPGQAVASGEPLGRCGNSGNTSEPHLHFHLQDAPRFGDGEGLPVFFNHYRADGKPVARGEPAQGQDIAPMTATEARP